MKRLIDSFATIGVLPQDDGNAIHQKRFLVMQAFLMSLGGILWALITFNFKLYFATLIPVGYVVISFFNMLVFARTKNFPKVRDIQTSATLLMPFFFQWALGGFLNSGCVMLWSLLAVAASLTYQSMKASALWVSLFLTLTLISGLLEGAFQSWLQRNGHSLLPSNLQVDLLMLNIVAVSLILFILVIVVMKNSTSLALKETYTKLVQAEKMGALGQLAAGIAHEVNTPLGAIKSSAEDSMVSLSELYTKMPELLNSVDNDTRNTFWKFAGIVKNNQRILSSKEEREKRKILSEELDKQAIPNSRVLAERLVQMGMDSLDATTQKLLAHPKAEELIMLAYNLANLSRNTENISVAVEKASRVVLALKKYLHSASQEEKVETDVRDNIETVLGIYHNQLKHGIEIIKNYEDVPKIMAHVDQLNQVWTNLIHNAIYAMKYNGKLTVGIKNIDKWVEIRIGDTGGGIPDEIKNKIFEPFFTTKPKGEGSGLGLDIVKTIIKEHGGFINFETEVGKGTTFIIRLPAKK